MASDTNLELMSPDEQAKVDKYANAQLNTSRPIARRNVDEEEDGFWSKIGRIFTFGCTETTDV